MPHEFPQTGGFKQHTRILFQFCSLCAQVCGPSGGWGRTHSRLLPLGLAPPTWAGCTSSLACGPVLLCSVSVGLPPGCVCLVCLCPPKILVTASRAPPDNPGQTPHPQILNLITSFGASEAKPLRSPSLSPLHLILWKDWNLSFDLCF